MSGHQRKRAAGGREGATIPLQSERPGDHPAMELIVDVERGVSVGRHWSGADAKRVLIGASPSCDLVLDDPQVSRLHCEIRLRAGRWQLVDLGSMNGTFVEGVGIRDADLPIREVALQLGGSKLKVRVKEPRAETTALGPVVFGRMYGASPPMQRLFAKIDRIAASDTDVLIEGESGSGKELVTAEIVSRSKRANKPLIIVDCGALAPSLVESELFGHCKGAFTGADRERAGAFEQADGGTVFLDEIGELPLELQPKLLRALAAREFRRVGETVARTVDVRVIAATNRRLESEVNHGRFREDLFFRLGAIRVDLPALRERLEDLPLLVGAFLQELDAGPLLDKLTADLYAELRLHSWPGNVRELRNWVKRFVVLEEREIPKSKDSVGDTAPEVDFSLPYSDAKARVVQQFERRYLKHVLDAAGGNVSKAARLARMDRMHFHRLLQRHELRRGTAIDD